MGIENNLNLYLHRYTLKSERQQRDRVEGMTSREDMHRERIEPSDIEGLDSRDNTQKMHRGGHSIFTEKGKQVIIALQSHGNEEVESADVKSINSSLESSRNPIPTPNLVHFSKMSPSSKRNHGTEKKRGSQIKVYGGRSTLPERPDQEHPHK